MTTIRSVRCSGCQTQFEVPKSLKAFACPQCQKRFRMGTASAAKGPCPPAPLSPAGSDKPAGTANRSQTKRHQAPHRPALPPDPEQSPKQRPKSWFVAWGLCAVGLLAAMSGMLIWLLGPYDGDQVSALNQQLTEARHNLSEIQQQHAALTALLPTVEQELSRTQITRDDQVADIDRLTAEINVYQGQLVEVQQQQLENQNLQLAVQERIAEDLTTIEAVEQSQDSVSVIARVTRSTLFIRTDLSSGSGFIINPRGLAVTNYHVIRCMSEMSVFMVSDDGQELTEVPGARLIAVDPRLDLALIILPGFEDTDNDEGRYPALTVRPMSEAIRAGEPVYAVGNPGLGDQVLTHTVTKGIISGASRPQAGYDMIQFTAAVNPGNSGGPLVDEIGRLLGVVTAKGAQVEAVGFAMTVSALDHFLRRQAEPRHAIVTSLADWERDHHPHDHIARRGMLHAAKQSHTFADEITQLQTAQNDQVLLVFGHSGRLTLFDTATYTEIASIALDHPIADVQVDQQREFAYVLCPNDRRISRIRLSDFVIADHLRDSSLTRATSMVLMGRRQDLVMIMREYDHVIFCDFSRIRSGPAAAIMQDFTVLTPSFASRSADLLHITNIEGDTVRMRVLDSEILARGVRSAFELKGRLQQHEQQMQYNASLRQSQTTLLERAPMRTFSFRALESGGFAVHVPVSAHDGRTIFCRRVLRASRQELEIDNELPANPQWSQFRRLSRDEHYFIMWLDRTLSVSSDTRYAVSGSCVYDLTTGQPIAHLPRLARLAVFGANSKRLHIVGIEGDTLATFQDWPEELPVITPGQ